MIYSSFYCPVCMISYDHNNVESSSSSSSASTKNVLPQSSHHHSNDPQDISSSLSKGEEGREVRELRLKSHEPYVLSGCGHILCVECLAMYCASQVMDGITDIRCCYPSKDLNGVETSDLSQAIKCCNQKIEEDDIVPLLKFLSYKNDKHNKKKTMNQVQGSEEEKQDFGVSSGFIQTKEAEPSTEVDVLAKYERFKFDAEHRDVSRRCPNCDEPHMFELRDFSSSSSSSSLLLSQNNSKLSQSEGGTGRSSKFSLVPQNPQCTIINSPLAEKEVTPSRWRSFFFWRSRRNNNNNSNSSNTNRNESSSSPRTKLWRSPQRASNTGGGEEYKEEIIGNDNSINNNNDTHTNNMDGNTLRNDTTQTLSTSRTTPSSTRNKSTSKISPPSQPSSTSLRHTTKQEPTQPIVHCKKCQSEFCYYHSNAHVGKTCQEYELEIEEETKKSATYLEKNTKLCPRCQASVQKIGGCNQMKCANCGLNFCWLCLAEVDDGTFPAHFQWWNLRGCPNMQLHDGFAPSRLVLGMSRLLSILQVLFVTIPAAVLAALSSVLCFCLVPNLGNTNRERATQCISFWGNCLTAAAACPLVCLGCIFSGILWVIGSMKRIVVQFKNYVMARMTSTNASTGPTTSSRRSATTTTTTRSRYRYEMRSELVSNNHHNSSSRKTTKHNRSSSLNDGPSSSGRRIQDIDEMHNIQAISLINMEEGFIRTV